MARQATCSPLAPSVLQKLKDALHTKLQGDFQQPLRLEILLPPYIPFPPSSSFQDFEIQKVHFDPHNRSFKADVTLLGEKEKAYPTTLSGPVIFLKRVPVFKENLAPGDILTKEKLYWQILDDDPRFQHVITDPAILEGAVVKGRIRAGDMPHPQNLKTDRFLEKNTPVVLIYESPALTISLSGRTLSKARIGEMILVTHPMAKKSQPIWGVVEPGQRVRLRVAS